MLLGGYVNKDNGIPLQLQTNFGQSSKIVHLAQVLSFAWLHNTALWSHNPPEKREEGAESLCPKRTKRRCAACWRRASARATLRWSTTSLTPTSSATTRTASPARSEGQRP